jgi:hypothetical protein
MRCVQLPFFSSPQSDWMTESGMLRGDSDTAASLQTFEFDVLAQHVLVLEIFDWDRFTKDDPMGRVSIPVTEMDGVTRWYQLQPMDGMDEPKGEIQLRCTGTLETDEEMRARERREEKAAREAERAAARAARDEAKAAKEAAKEAARAAEQGALDESLDESMGASSSSLFESSFESSSSDEDGAKAAAGAAAEAAAYAASAEAEGKSSAATALRCVTLACIVCLDRSIYISSASDGHS